MDCTVPERSVIKEMLVEMGACLLDRLHGMRSNIVKEAWVRGLRVGVDPASWPRT